MAKWIEAFQRIKRNEMYTVGRIWSSGYVVAANGIDIEDAFILIRLPSWGITYNIAQDCDQMAQRCVVYIRSKGWFLRWHFGE